MKHKKLISAARTNNSEEYVLPRRPGDWQKFIPILHTRKSSDLEVLVNDLMRVGVDTPDSSPSDHSTPVTRIVDS
jgi:hypothetical protein